MSQGVTTPEVLSVLGFLLSLTGLLGTFFYVHLSNWFREILELKSKYDLNAVGETEQRREGRLQCRYQLQRLYNHVPLLVSAIITSFIFVLIEIARDLTSGLDPMPPVLRFYERAFSYFIVSYLALTAYFLIYGYTVAYRLRRRMEQAQN